MKNLQKNEIHSVGYGVSISLSIEYQYTECTPMHQMCHQHDIENLGCALAESSITSVFLERD
jgi:hypothetical protein